MKIPFSIAAFLGGAVLLLVLKHPMPLSAQAVSQLPFKDRPHSDVAFRQELNAYTWVYGLDYSKNFDGKLDLGFRERFISSMLRMSSGVDRWKDDQRLLLFGTYNLSHKWKLVFQSNSSVFSDQQSGFHNDIVTNYIGGGSRYSPSRGVDFSGTLGGKWDRRFDRLDSGVSYGLLFNADRLDLGGYLTDLALELGGDEFSVRENRDFSAGYTVARRFAQGTSDSLQMILERRRRDNYFSLQGDIEIYEDESRGISNLLRYRLAESVDFNLSNAVLYKDVDVAHRGETIDEDQRRRRDRRFDHWLGLAARRWGTDVRFRLGYWTQEQRYDIALPEPSSPFSSRAAFIAPDNKSSRLSLTGDANIKVTASDSLATRFSVSRVQYDTPDTSNFDDRDELRINASVVEQHDFGTALKLRMTAAVNLYHTVYIFAEHSADNNWNRIFRLTTRAFFEPSRRFNVIQSFEVLANYVDYDYESELEETRSFVFRKFVANDSLSWQATERSQIRVHSRLLLEENGRLFWDKWAEQPLVSRSNLWARVTWRYRLWSGVSISSGYMYYQRRGWRHTFGAGGEWMQEEYETYSSKGPLLHVEYRASSRLSVRFHAARQMVEPSGHNRYYLNNIDLNLDWYL